MLIGAAYIRVSTDDQLDLSPDSQLDEIKNMPRQTTLFCRLITFSWSRKPKRQKSREPAKSSSG